MSQFDASFDPLVPTEIDQSQKPPSSGSSDINIDDFETVDVDQIPKSNLQASFGLDMDALTQNLNMSSEVSSSDKPLLDMSGSKTDSKLMGSSDMFDPLMDIGFGKMPEKDNLVSSSDISPNSPPFGQTDPLLMPTKPVDDFLGYGKDEFDKFDDNIPSHLVQESKSMPVPKDISSLIDTDSLLDNPTFPIEEPAPMIFDHILPSKEVKPLSSDPISLPKESTPPVKEPTPPAKESAPPAKEATPPPKEITPTPKEPTPLAKEPTPPPQEPTPPSKEPTPPPKEPTPPPKEPTSPPKEPTPPPKEPTPPPKEPTPPPKEPTPPPKEPTPPPREPTPPPREPTPPPREPTPPPREPRAPTPPPKDKEISPMKIQKEPSPCKIEKVAVKTRNVLQESKISCSKEVKESLAIFNPRAWFHPDQLDPRVVELIYWHDVKKTGIVFGSIILLLLSLAYLSLISVIAYTSLTALTGTICFRIYKNIMQAIQKSTDGHPFREYLELDTNLPAEKVHEVTDVLVGQINSMVSELKRLFLVEDLVDSVKFGSLLWGMTYIGSWFNGLTLVILSVIALFSLPKVYEQNQAQVDQYVGLARAQVNDVMTKIKAAIPIGNKEKSQ